MSKKNLFVILLCLVAMVAQGMPSDVAFKEYSPPFYQWVRVYLNALYKMRNDDYALDFLMQRVGDEIKVLVFGRAQKTRFGRSFLYELMPEIRESIERACVSWQRDGYQIQYPDDFIFDLEYYE